MTRLTESQFELLKEIGDLVRPFALNDGRITVSVVFTCKCGQDDCNGAVSALCTFEASVRPVGYLM